MTDIYSTEDGRLSQQQIKALANATEAQMVRAVKHGVIAVPYIPADVIALRAYTLGSSVLWPGEERPRNVRDTPHPKRLSAAQTAKSLALEEDLPRDAVLYLTPTEIRVAKTRAERIELELNGKDEPALRMPIGAWAADLPDAVAEALAQAAADSRKQAGRPQQAPRSRNPDVTHERPPNRGHLSPDPGRAAA